MRDYTYIDGNRFNINNHFRSLRFDIDRLDINWMNAEKKPDFVRGYRVVDWTDLIFSTTPKERIFDNLQLKGVLNMTKGQRLKPEQIVTLLRQIDVLTTNGKTLAQACKEVGTVEQSYYRWRKMYGGMKVDQARKYKDLELENTRLKKLVADLSLREAMLKEVIKGNF